MIKVRVRGHEFTFNDGDEMKDLCLFLVSLGVKSSEIEIEKF